MWELFTQAGPVGEPPRISQDMEGHQTMHHSGLNNESNHKLKLFNVIKQLWSSFGIVVLIRCINQSLHFLDNCVMHRAAVADLWAFAVQLTSTFRRTG